MSLEATLTPAAPAPTRPKPHRCDLTPGYQNDSFHPKTISYAEAAKKYEKYMNNNSTFNEKSLSDAKKITPWYLSKERGIDYVNRKKPVHEEHLKNQQRHMSGDKAYTQNMLNQLFDEDCAIKVATMPSNLTEIPRVHEKYEMSGFMKGGPQYQANLKTVEILRNNGSGQAILNLNPGFFGTASEKAQVEVPLKDPYSDLL